MRRENDPPTPKHQPNPNDPWQAPFPPIRMGPTQAFRERHIFSKWKRLIEGIIFEKSDMPDIMAFDPFSEK